MSLKLFNIKLKRKLFKLFKMNKRKLKQKNKNIIKLVSNKQLLLNAYNKLKRGNNTIKPIELTFLVNLSNQIKLGDYLWSCVKKRANKVSKSQQIKQQHIWIFSFKDQLVQEAMRIVLKIIFSRIFNLHQQDFEKQLIQQFKFLKSSNLKYASQGKFQSIYHHGDSKIVMKILNKKISDTAFLELIKSLLIWKSVKKLKNSFGILKGEILSNILVEIYLQEFDFFINKQIYKFNNINWVQNILMFNKHKVYKKYELKTSNNLAQTQCQKLNILTFKNKRQIFKKCHWLKIQTQKCQNTTTQFYYWYKMKWIFFFNNNFLYKTNLKQQIISWLKQKLKLSIKTNWIFITNLNKNKLSYLGFIFFNKPYIIKKEVHKHGISSRKKLVNCLNISIAHNYIKKKFVKEQMINEKHKPYYVLNYSRFNFESITKKFIKTFSKFVKFYYNKISTLNDLRFYYFVFKFSCFKTLNYKLKKKTKAQTNNFFFPTYSNFISKSKK